MNDLLETFGGNPQDECPAIFASLFVLQNRLQSAGEKIEEELTMKQWLLLAITSICPPPRTFTNIGAIMGCSRQNVKKLAAALESRGYLAIEDGAGNSVQLSLTDKAEQYGQTMQTRHATTLQLLFEDFDEQQIDDLFASIMKLYRGVERVEAYASRLSQ